MINNTHVKTSDEKILFVSFLLIMDNDASASFHNLFRMELDSSSKGMINIQRLFFFYLAFVSRLYN